MIFYFLISIVFIAEIIIALAILLNLYKFDKTINEYNSLAEELKPLINDMLETTRKISEKLLEAAPKIVNKIKASVTDIIMGQLKGMLGALTFWLVKKEVEKHV